MKCTCQTRRYSEKLDQYLQAERCFIIGKKGGTCTHKVVQDFSGNEKETLRNGSTTMGKGFTTTPVKELERSPPISFQKVVVSTEQ